VKLFDEIEKAHPDVWNTLLQILEEGRMTDGQGRAVDFRNTVHIMTSNLGTEFTKRGGALGFIRDGSEQAIADHQKIEKAMRDTFRPEFLNRIDEIIIFSPLSQSEVKQIVDIQMAGVFQRLAETGLSIHVTEEARDWLAAKGFDTQYGARPLRRAIQRFVENPLSIRLLKGDFSRGDLVLIDVQDSELIFEKHRDVPLQHQQHPSLESLQQSSLDIQREETTTFPRIEPNENEPRGDKVPPQESGEFHTE
jgi:ATP-dependent Clp protease ATP-binding subunit ClpC